MKKIIQTLKHSSFQCSLILASLIFTQQAQAAFDRIYIEPQISLDTIKLESGSYSLSASGFKAGFFMLKKVSFEVLVAKGLREDSVNDLSVKMKNRSSIFLRYGSDYTRRIRAYMSLGQSTTTLSYTGPISSSEEKLTDLSWALGAEERIRYLPAGSFLNFEYARHFSNNDQSYSSFSMGYHYEF